MSTFEASLASDYTGALELVLIRPFGTRILPLLPFTGFRSRLRRKQTTPSIALSPPS
jgi:hypothetical protein